MRSTSEAVQDFLLLDGLQILAVDDEEDALLLLKLLLEGQGAVVTTATSAQAALEALSLCQADVLISDIAMPGEDGLSLIQKVRSLDAAQGGAVSAIAFSALDPELCASDCLAAGFQCYVAKPIDPEHLIETVLNLVPLRSKQLQKQRFKMRVDSRSRLA